MPVSPRHCSPDLSLRSWALLCRGRQGTENMGRKCFFLSILRVEHLLAYSSDPNTLFFFCSDVCSSNTVVSLRCIGKRLFVFPFFSEENTLHLQRCIPSVWEAGDGLGWPEPHARSVPQLRSRNAFLELRCPGVQPRGREAAVPRGQAISGNARAPLSCHPEVELGAWVSPSLCLAYFWLPNFHQGCGRHPALCCLWDGPVFTRDTGPAAPLFSAKG